MAMTNMATVTEAAALLYYTLGHKSLLASNGDENEENNNDTIAKSKRTMKKRVVVRPAQAPATWLEMISTLSEALRFAYSKMSGKWPISELAFNMNFL